MSFSTNEDAAAADYVDDLQRFILCIVYAAVFLCVFVYEFTLQRDRAYKCHLIYDARVRANLYDISD